MSQDHVRETILRPHSSVLAQGIVAALALTVPIFAVLYWLTIPDGTWPTVLVIHALVVAVALIGVYAYRTTCIRIRPGEISERRFFGKTIRVDPRAVGRVLSAELYHGADPEPRPHLFVCDHEGRLLLRMRGQFWSQDSMACVARALGVPVITQPTPMTVGDMRGMHPELLYWFERMPGLDTAR